MGIRIAEFKETAVAVVEHLGCPNLLSLHQCRPWRSRARNDHGCISAIWLDR